MLCCLFPLQQCWSYVVIWPRSRSWDVLPRRQHLADTWMTFSVHQLWPIWTPATKTDRDDHYDADIRAFVKEFLDEKLFSYIPGRKFCGFKTLHPKGKNSSAKLAIYLHKIRKNQMFIFENNNQHRTHFLKLIDNMFQCEIVRACIVEDRAHTPVHGAMDRQMDAWTLNHYSPF